MATQYPIDPYSGVPITAADYGIEQAQPITRIKNIVTTDEVMLRRPVELYFPEVSQQTPDPIDTYASVLNVLSQGFVYIADYMIGRNLELSIDAKISGGFTGTWKLQHSPSSLEGSEVAVTQAAYGALSGPSTLGPLPVSLSGTVISLGIRIKYTGGIFSVKSQDMMTLRVTD